MTYERSHVAAWLRLTTSHRLAPVRAAVADVLDGLPNDRLLDELDKVYADPELWVFLEALTRGWLAHPDPVLAECGLILSDARELLWDRGSARL